MSSSLSLVGVSWILPLTMNDLFLSWHGSCVGGKCAMICLCLSLMIWQKRIVELLRRRKFFVNRIKLKF